MCVLDNVGICSVASCFLAAVVGSCGGANVSFSFATLERGDFFVFVDFFVCSDLL